MNTLGEEMAAAGLPAAPRCLEQLRMFYDLLMEARASVNLTAVSGWENVREHLLLRSLRLSPVLAAAPPDSSLIDIGAGGGIPGLVLKIVHPALSVVLVESNGRKADFLHDTIEKLGLQEATAIHSRAEDLAARPAHRERFDIAVARAVGPLSELAELLLPFVRVGGRAAAMKGSGVELEAADAAYAAAVMGAKEAALIPVAAPGSSPADTMVVWEKETATPDRYPRRAGMPGKRPLMDRHPHAITEERA